MKKLLLTVAMVCCTLISYALTPNLELPNLHENQNDLSLSSWSQNAISSKKFTPIPAPSIAPAYDDTRLFSVWFGYKPVFMKWSDNQDDYEKAVPIKHGIALGLTMLPSCEGWTGKFDVQLQYTMGKESTEVSDNSFNMFSFIVGLGGGYGIELKDTNIVLIPTASIYCKINYVGTLNIDAKSEYSSYLEDTKYDLLYDTNEMKAVQGGIDFGLDLKLERLHLGISYALDFNCLIDYGDKGRMNSLSIKMGVAF